MENTIYTIALTMVPTIGPITGKQLIHFCGSAKNIFSRSYKELLKIPGVGMHLADSLSQQKYVEKGAQLWENMQKAGIKCLYFKDPDFPRRLKPYRDCPILLYYKGQASLNQNRIVAIVGTRKPSTYGQKICRQITMDLQAAHPLIVSGLAYGIDITVHKSCLEAGIPTLGVVAHGLDQMYPPAHFNTAQAMLKQGGLLSEHPFGVEVERDFFPMRNRIIAAIADAIVVVESKEKGGSMITAQFGNLYNKDVFAIPGSIGSPNSAGPHRLIKGHQAALVEGAKDIITAMGWDMDKEFYTRQQQLFVELSEQEKIIVDLLRQKGTAQYDELFIAAGLTPSQTTSALLNLEFNGIVKTLPGNSYELF